MDVLAEYLPVLRQRRYTLSDIGDKTSPITSAARLSDWQERVGQLVSNTEVDEACTVVGVNPPFVELQFAHGESYDEMASLKPSIDDRVPRSC